VTNIINFTQYRVHKLIQKTIKNYNIAPILSTLNSLTCLLETFYQTNDSLAFDRGLQYLTLTTNINKENLLT